MRQRINILAATFALLVLATIILALSQKTVQAQTTPNLSVAGAIFGGTKLVNAQQGPVPPCYTSAGIGCDGKFHVVSDHTTAPVSPACTPNGVCSLTASTSYITVPLSGAAQFATTNFACSATIWTASAAAAAYVGYCQPQPSPSPATSALYIYMYNPGPGTVSGTVTINYSAWGV